MNKTVLYVFTLAGGAIMTVIGLLIKEEAMKAVSGIMIGIGAGLVGMSLSALTSLKYLKNHPFAAKQAQIESKDERNIMIRARAKAAAADVTRWFILALAYVMILIDAPLWATLCVVAVYSLYHILALVFMVRFQKQM